jgi:hypothetical protein
VRAGAYTFLAARTLRGVVNADMLMKFERRLADNMTGTDCDAFPARLTLMGIQANESCRLMPDERTVQLHQMSPMILLEDGIGLA